ncbi:MAG: hypothetical protein ABH856_01695 [Patescibacteria group bacterium]|nr:hypothetical protein [Patescibacteria group bacterium]
MVIDKENEEKKTDKLYRQKDYKKRKRMHISGKSVFELQKLMEESTGKRITKLKNSPPKAGQNH